MSKQDDLIARLAAAEAEIATVKAELAKADKPEPWVRWQPCFGEQYWLVGDEGYAQSVYSAGGALTERRYNFGNVHRTPAAAERHAKRIRSMVPTCPVPKVGDKYWFAVFSDGRMEVSCPRKWSGEAADIYLYNRGLVSATPEACAQWIAEYAEAWTTLEDEA